MGLHGPNVLDGWRSKILHLNHLFMPEVATPPPVPSKVAAPPVTSPATTPTPRLAPSSATPEPGSRESIYASLEKRANKSSESSVTPAKPASPPPPPKEPAKPETPKPETAESESDEFSDATASEPQPSEVKPADKPSEKPVAATAEVPKDKKGKELGPWALKKLAEERALKAERELEEYRKVTPNAERLKKREEEFQAIQKRNEELESEIRYANYTKSKEFTEKYQKPYDDAWQTAMNDLSEIPVQDGERTRPLTVDDIAQLVYMPLARAKEEAVAKFGNFADDVMAARKEIRRLGETRDKALEEAKKVAGEREKQLAEHWQSQRATIKAEVSKAWQEANAAVQHHEKFGQYFRPIDGDEAGNAALEKGFNVVDEAFAMNAADPKLTAEQRAILVKKQVAVRNRAAAFGRLTIQLTKAHSRIKELESKVAELEGGEPTVDGRNGDPAPAAPMNERDRLHSAIEAAARKNR